MKIEFLNKTQAREYFKEMDEYALNLKKSDLRVMGFNSREEYFKSFKSNFINFNILDKIKYRHYLKKVSHLKITVKLIKIKETHDMDLFQTRKEAIIVPNLSKANDSLMVHEVFHIISRKFDFSKLYNVLGFKKCNEEFIKDHGLLTNPDCVKNNYSINLKVFDKETKKENEKECIPYLSFPFFKKVKLVGEDKTYHISETNFQELFPLTSYLSHPEEICAEHFAFKFTGKPISSFILDYENKPFFNELDNLMKIYNII